MIFENMFIVWTYSGFQPINSFHSVKLKTKLYRGGLTVLTILVMMGTRHACHISFVWDQVCLPSFLKVSSRTHRLSLTIICKASVMSRTGWMLLDAELLRRLKFSNKKDNLEARKQGRQFPEHHGRRFASRIKRSAINEI